MGNESIRILCVDDEASILQMAAYTLGDRFEVLTATSGPAALEILKGDHSVAVVISDLQMPKMDGAAFLAKARDIVPDAVRILLTGIRNLDDAVNAVNEGQIFRFLTKPCTSKSLLMTAESAVEQHRLITAERVLLEQTLHGCIKALTEVLALSKPISYGRGERVKRLVTEIAGHLHMQETWHVEVAAMLSQLGYIVLPPPIAEKVYYGRPLTSDEQQLVDQLPEITLKMLGNIPRLESVRGILSNYSKPFRAQEMLESDSKEDTISRASQILKVALAFDALENMEGATSSHALATMNGRAGQYAPAVLSALVALRGDNSSQMEIREMPLESLRTGMILAEDIKLANGLLLVARGHEVTQKFLDLLPGFLPNRLQKTLWRVEVRPQPGLP